VPFYCFDCDSNPFYRWSGTDYEPMLVHLGEKIALLQGNADGVDLYPDASLQSKHVASRKLCSVVKVLNRRGRSYERRWYFVQSASPDSVRGWVPASSVTWTGCGPIS